MPRKPIAIRWPDGTRQEAATWTELLDAVNRLPWNQDLDPIEMREALIKRAHVWSGKDIDVHPSDHPRAIFHALAEARLVEIL